MCLRCADSYTVRFYDGVVRTVKPTKVKPFQEVRNDSLHAFGLSDCTSDLFFKCVCVCACARGGLQQNSRTEKTAMGSEEEFVDKQEEEKEVEEKTGVDEKRTCNEKDRGNNGEEERKRKAGLPSCHSPGKKKADEGKPNRLILPEFWLFS